MQRRIRISVGLYNDGPTLHSHPCGQDLALGVHSQTGHAQLVGLGGVHQVQPALAAVPLVVGGGPALPLLQTQHPTAECNTVNSL